MATSRAWTSAQSTADTSAAAPGRFVIDTPLPGESLSGYLQRAGVPSAAARQAEEGLASSESQQEAGRPELDLGMEVGGRLRQLNFLMDQVRQGGGVRVEQLGSTPTTACLTAAPPNIALTTLALAPLVLSVARASTRSTRRWS